MDLTLSIIKADGTTEALTILEDMLLITERGYRNNMVRFIKLRKAGKKYAGLASKEMSDKIKAARDKNYDETVQTAIVMQGSINQLGLMMMNEFVKEATLGEFLKDKDAEIYASFKHYVEDIMAPALAKTQGQPTAAPAAQEKTDGQP